MKLFVFIDKSEYFWGITCVFSNESNMKMVTFARQKPNQSETKPGNLSVQSDSKVKFAYLYKTLIQYNLENGKNLPWQKWIEPETEKMKICRLKCKLKIIIVSPIPCRIYI